MTVGETVMAFDETRKRNRRSVRSHYFIEGKQRVRGIPSNVVRQILGVSVAPEEQPIIDDYYERFG